MKGNVKIQRCNKKSQAEIVGIAIVMVLIMLGLVFVIKYVIAPERSDVKGHYDSTELAANFINTMLKTTTNCNKLRMTELIQNCIENYGTSFEYLCPDDALICTNSAGCRSCDYLNSTIDYLLNQSLVMMNQRFDLLICDWDETQVECRPNHEAVLLTKEDISVVSNFSFRTCLTGNTGYESKQTSIPTGLGTRVVQIYVC